MAPAHLNNYLDRREPSITFIFISHMKPRSGFFLSRNSSYHKRYPCQYAALYLYFGLCSPRNAVASPRCISIQRGEGGGHLVKEDRSTSSRGHSVVSHN